VCAGPTAEFGFNTSFLAAEFSGNAVKFSPIAAGRLPLPPGISHRYRPLYPPFRGKLVRTFPMAFPLDAFFIGKSVPSVSGSPETILILLQGVVSEQRLHLVADVREYIAAGRNNLQ
jgi:hypothetical protein